MRATIKIRLRFWVRPFLYAAISFLMVMRPFLTEEDVDRFVEVTAHFVARHGLALVWV